HPVAHERLRRANRHFALFHAQEFERADPCIEHRIAQLPAQPLARCSPHRVAVKIRTLGNCLSHFPFAFFLLAGFSRRYSCSTTQPFSPAREIVRAAKPQIIVVSWWPPFRSHWPLRHVL